MEFKGTKNWRIRKHDNFFFIEADLPNADKNGFYPRLEVMQEDFGDHNGYTKKLRLADALLISKAPEMLEMLIKCRDYFLLKSGEQAENNADAIEQLIKEATEL